ncbi:glycoside hydrolase domain-containing protein [Actinoplanes sp. CA-030573]|uniref:glycoside hydrolase domain-containing protein n=1 Tax=Actinoplanes sp. CA-030573 TaxID=3239898 RepID=UPI003D91371B
MVLEAQRWVNSTYRGVAGFNPAPENGKTGWPTMYALTRALQHELGITALSDAFGPTTLGKLAAHGNITFQESNANIVKIVQSGLWCKGYDAGPIDGRYAEATDGAIQDMGGNAGVLATAGVSPKIFKALLTMDAYVVVAGGSEAVRAIQATLNHNYIHRRDFFIIPCDGIFSRDVQKAMYLAIQFELGMTDDEATGIFGPKTQAGLRAHPLSQGSSGVWVQLFSAAIVFNRVRTGDADFYTNFTSNYTADLTAAVRTFQKFSALDVNGNADFATWCQALVSTGDPDRKGTALDCITTITDARAQALKAAGYKIVGRYLDEHIRPPRVPLNKWIQPGELDTIFRNGLKVFPISQYDGGSLSYFTYSQGFQDALEAHAKAVGYGFNTGTVIYFAVDYDATQDDINSAIVPYFKGVVAGLASKGKKYVHGVYGSRNVCAEVTSRTLARWSFVSGMSYGFSGNMGFPLPDNWAFNQVQTLTVGSGSGAIEIDKDVWRPSSDPGVSSVNDPSTPVDDFIAYIRQLYSLAVSYGGSKNPSQLVLEYLRHDKYDNFVWTKLIGGIDQGFIDKVDGSGIKKIYELRDPFYGVDLHVNHLGATCNGVYVVGKPATVTSGKGDVAGWGGDLMTFYGEWRRDSDSYSSGYTYCQEKLAKVNANTTFELRDLTEDADGYNIAMRLRSGVDIVTAVTSYYKGGGYLSRMKDFYLGRFGSAVNLKAIAQSMLLSDNDLDILLGRTFLVESTAGDGALLPNLIPPSKLDEFLQGFTDVIVARVGQENAKAKALRAQGKI